MIETNNQIIILPWINNKANTFCYEIYMEPSIISNDADIKLHKIKLKWHAS